MVFFALLTIITSFCSMSYQLILVKAFYIYANDVLHQCLTLGVYLLFLGIGSLKIENKQKTLEPINSFLKVEVILSLLGATSILLIKILIIFSNFIIPYSYLPSLLASEKLGLYISQIVTALIGYYSGKEIPLLIEMSKPYKSLKYNTVLGISYFGGLMASFLVPLFFYPSFGDANSTLLISFLNVLVIAICAQFFYKRKFKHLLLALGLTIFIIQLVSLNKKTSDFFNKVIYSELRMATLNPKSLYWGFKNILLLENVEQVRSKYQTIDIVPSHFFSHFGKEHHTSMYIDNQPQFSTKYWKTYHESFYWSGVSINRSHPKNVLILGGGDGILANQILKFNPKRPNITLVELDEKVIELAKSNRDFLKLNNHIFEKKRINLIVNDAITFLKSTKTKYDVIYIDFPVPTTFTLSKLFTSEFYSLVKNRLVPDGYFIFDAPLWANLETKKDEQFNNLSILYNTLKHAGLNNILVFGPFDPFIYVTKKDEHPMFDYSFIEKENLFNKTFVNLTPIVMDYEKIPIHLKYVNRLLSPKLFKN